MGCPGLHIAPGPGIPSVSHRRVPPEDLWLARCPPPPLSCMQAGPVSHSSPPAASPRTGSGDRRQQWMPVHCGNADLWEGLTARRMAWAGRSHSFRFLQSFKSNFKSQGTCRLCKVRRAMDTGWGLFGKSHAGSEMALKSWPQEGGVSHVRNPFKCQSAMAIPTFPKPNNNGRATERRLCTQVTGPSSQPWQNGSLWKKQGRMRLCD